MANLNREIAVEDDVLRVFDEGELSRTEIIPEATRRSLDDHARALASIEPRRRYGQPGYRSDVLTLTIDVSDEEPIARIDVIHDPRDPAPSEVLRLIHEVLTLAGGEV